MSEQYRSLAANLPPAILEEARAVVDVKREEFKAEFPHTVDATLCDPLISETPGSKTENDRLVRYTTAHVDGWESCSDYTCQYMGEGGANRRAAFQSRTNGRVTVTSSTELTPVSK